MKLRINNFDYYNILENKEDPELACPIFVACGREEDGTYHTIKIPGNKGIFRPHFYVKDNYTNRGIIAELGLEFSEWPYPSAYDETEAVLVVYVTYPFEVPHLRPYFENTYEADVKYAKMFIMKLNLEGAYMEVPDGKDWMTTDEVEAVPEDEHFNVEPRIFYFDIETDSINREDPFDIDNCFIISMAVYDNYINEYTILEWDWKHDELWTEERTAKTKIKYKDLPRTSKLTIIHCCSEKELLMNFFLLFRNRPDAIMGFNSHGGYQLRSIKSKSMRVWQNGFDEPVIFKRAIKLGLEKDMQLMSPLPRVKNKYGNYYGVYKRGNKGKLEMVMRGTTSLDFYAAEPLMAYTSKYRDFFGRSLDAYLKYFAKRGKVEHIGLTVAELKKQDLEKEMEYNRMDVEGLFFLDKRFGFSSDIFDTVALSKMPGIEVLSATRIHDMIMLDYSQDKVVFDTKYQKWNRNVWRGWLNSRHGGYVVNINRGVGGWTVILDFSGLYPNLASSANAGVDTLIQVAEEFPDYYIDKFDKKWMKKDTIWTPSAPFRKDKISIEKQIWDKLLGFRKKYKKILADIFEKNGGNTDDPLYKLYWSKQYNLKTRLVNNKYGASGNPAFRNFCLPVYNVPPSMGQLIIKALETNLIPSIDYKLRGGDTDSIFIALRSDNIEDAIKESEYLVGECNQFVDRFMKTKFNIDDHNVVMGWEKIGPKFYGHMKKNYLMEIWAQDGKVIPEKNHYIMYKGFEMKKSNRADITELIQRAYFKLAFDSKDNKEFLEKIAKFIKRIDRIFPHLPWDKISQRVTIRKHLTDYHENYFARRAAEFSNKVIGTDYTIGSHGFVGWIGGSVRELSGVFMFSKEDIKKVKDKGIEINYLDHKKKFVINKLNLLLDDYNTGYWKLLRAGRIKSPNVL